MYMNWLIHPDGHFSQIVYPTDWIERCILVDQLSQLRGYTELELQLNL